MKRSDFISFVGNLQDKTCSHFASFEETKGFECHEWQRAGGGGGNSRVLENGDVFEKAAVNTSVVNGPILPEMVNQFPVNAASFFATGISVITHPRNPFVPTMHFNLRYFELMDENDDVIDSWFGGGCDLTPYYLFEEDALHFHSTLKNASDPFGLHLYPEHKKYCDNYFVNKHRNNERRGIGGVFFDHIRESQSTSKYRWFEFVRSYGDAFLLAYFPIVEKRGSTAYGDHETEWQQMRRGRYVEFNLLHDRGTTFGLRSGGRTESILMSLPPTVRFCHNEEALIGEQEEKLMQVLRSPRDWVTTLETVNVL